MDQPQSRSIEPARAWSLLPRLRGRRWPTGRMRGTCVSTRGRSSIRPLTLALSPSDGGEGTGVVGWAVPPRIGRELVGTAHPTILLGLLLFGLVSGLLADEKPDPPTSRSTVGVAVPISQIVLPGSELEAKPVEDRKAPMVVRILGTFRHGSDYRYDLEYYGLEPGRFDLRDSLQRKDRSQMDGVAPLWVEIDSRLPPGQIVPSDFAATSLPNVGGYRTAMYGLFIGWAAITLWLAMGRRRARTAAMVTEHVPTLAERLRPLVTQAVAGQLSPEGQAELERLLLGYWRSRLGVTDADPVTAMATLYEHPEAGAVLRLVEDWLHRQGGNRDVDIAAVLAPYQHVVDETVDEPQPVAMAGGR